MVANEVMLRDASDASDLSRILFNCSKCNRGKPHDAGSMALKDAPALPPPTTLHTGSRYTDKLAKYAARVHEVRLGNGS